MSTQPFPGAAVLVSVGCLLAFVATTHAEDQPASAAAGLRFAEMWCSGCHPVELRTARTGGIAPDFRTIAARPTTTAPSLRSYLESSHPLMPNFRLTREEGEDVIAYILSLKDPNHK